MFSYPAQADFRGLPQITVLAASSLSGPMTKLIRLYSRQYNVTVTASYDAASEQANKIHTGESADVFISSHPQWMSELKQKGVVDVYSIMNLVQNDLVLVTSVSSYLNHYILENAPLKDQLMNLMQRSIMVIGDPETPLGMYTRQALEALTISEGGSQENLWEMLHNKAILASDAKKTLYLIERRNTAGIIYASDAYNNEAIRVIARLPLELHEPVVYQAAVVAGENMTLARGFLAFLSGPMAKHVFAEYGLKVQ
ncbi:MAG: molybdate ABC transporter substrate-binding protein [Sinomicrobium sp.]|nr:molybdate ABC transporter substrate-binding protein [Sinomicrobium sp.]